MSKYFGIHEVIKSQYGTVTPTDYQIALANRLFQVLHIPRDYFGFVFDITSGMRNKTIVGGMLADGTSLNSSTRTDHSYMDPDVYLFGVGAIDFTCKKCKDVFYWIMEKTMNRKLLAIGQLIWYPERNFIHISNPKSLIFSQDAIKMFGIPILPKYLIYDEKNKKFKNAFL